MPNRSNTNLRGIAFMLTGMVGMAGTDASGKWLVVADYSVLQVLAVRGWIIVALMLAWVAFRNDWRGLKTKRPFGHALRLFFNFAGPMFLFLAYRDMPLADVMVILFGGIFLTTALSVPLFGEHVGIHRWAAIVVGFVGVAVVLRPGLGLFQPALLYALLAGACFSGLNLCARWLRGTEGTFRLTFHAMFGVMVLSTAALPWVWQPMPLGDFAVFAVMGACTLFGYIFMTRAFVAAPVGVVAPFEFTVLVWGVIFGFLLWGDVPDMFVWTGAALVVASGIYLVHREARANVQPVADGAPV
jgi:drug/metabolite transporter (DMT)-like permease